MMYAANAAARLLAAAMLLCQARAYTASIGGHCNFGGIRDCCSFRVRPRKIQHCGATAAWRRHLDTITLRPDGAMLTVRMLRLVDGFTVPTLSLIGDPLAVHSPNTCLLGTRLGNRRRMGVAAGSCAAVRFACGSIRPGRLCHSSQRCPA